MSLFKTTLMLWTLALSSITFAQDAASADPLLSAQLAYQKALKLQKNSVGKVGSLERQVNQARQRVTEAQADVEKYQSLLNQAQSEDAANVQALQAASQQLDAAWAARNR